MWKEDIVKEACERFQGAESSLKLLGGFYQNVYEYERNGEACVLKLIPIAAKDRNLVYSENQWVSYLRTHRVNIPSQILSMRGQTVETIQRLPVPCCAISFKKASGRLVDVENPNEWNQHLFRHWGQVMGKMHALSLKFHHRQSIPPFEEWNEGEIYYRDLSFAEGPILDRFSSYLEQIETLPKTEKNYGLIHNDFHHRNFLVNGAGELILYDFNRVKYHWFTYDIAIALYHALETVSEEEKNSFKEQFLQAFIAGYLTEHQLENAWQEQVEFFMEFHHLFRYLYLMVYLQMDHISEETKQMLQKMRGSLENKATTLS